METYHVYVADLGHAFNPITLEQILDTYVLGEPDFMEENYDYCQ